MSVLSAAAEIIDRIRNRRNAYRTAFLSPAGQTMLEHLSGFCRASETCFHADARVHAVLEGRREVWLEIQRHLNLSTQELFQLYNAKTIQQEEE